MMSTERASSSVPSSPWTYDVFLSFRGEDTRNGFTNYLYNSLKDHGMMTFMDDPELQKGKSISPELVTAIEGSNIALIVLSRNYASSTWCLDELLKILECMEARQTILPIFYDVDPSDVRKQTGPFAEAFTKHETRFVGDTEKVQRWRAALTKVSNFSGWNSNDFRPELELIKKIVAEVRTRSRPKLFSSMENLIGIDSRVGGVHNLLFGVGMDEVHFIGVWGMGGIGKTTIAKVLFDRISYQFEFSRFIPDVRSNAERSGLVQLQKELISKMLGREIDVRDFDEGATMMKRFVRDKKVLLVLDDINHSRQIEYLAGKKDWFGSGSIIIITTRDAHLLVEHRVRRRFQVHGLNNIEALQLFCLHAFKKDYPEQSYRNLSNRVVKYTKGLPLALKVLGSFLHGRGESVWESALESLGKVCDKEIFETLKISYDGLRDNEKKIFLDIACFYIGDVKKVLRRVLNRCGFDATIGIEVLMERSLVTISTAGRVEMHDLLREMGLEIVRRESRDEPGKRSRLCLEEDVIHVLRKNRGTEAVEGIVLRRANIVAVHLPGKSFSKMTNLRVLIFNSVGVVHLSDGLEYVSSELRFLIWRNCPLQSLASLNNLENLQELYMRNSQIEYLWEGKKHLYSLKRIDLSQSLNLLKTPDFSGCPNLEILNLEGCIKLYEVDSSVGFLGRLTHMSLRSCTNLRILPSSVSGLKSLKILNLSDCSKLEKLPEDLGRIESLEFLYASGTASRELPASCTGLQNLRELWFSGCRGPPISKLLPSFAGLHSLTKLHLAFSNLLEGAIPNDLGCLSSLTKLYLNSNQFVTLPESLSELHKLEVLYLNNCRDLERLPKLPARVKVYAANCISLEIVPEHLSQAYFLNCLKLVRQGCNSVAFTSMKRHIQDQARRDTLFEIVIPGSNIPGWFDHPDCYSAAASLSMDLRPGWFNKDFVGFALCVVFAVHRNRQLPPMRRNKDVISCIVTVDGQELNSTPVDFNFNGLVKQTVSDHLWLHYDVTLSKHIRGLETAELKQIEFSFRISSNVLVVKKCGVRLVYEQDVAEIMESNAEISEEAVELPPCDDSGKAAVVSDISKRGLPHSSGEEGSSASVSSLYNVKGWGLAVKKFWVRLVPLCGRHVTTEVKQSNDDYVGAFSFYKERRPDSLQTLRSVRVQKPLPPTHLSDLIKPYPKRGLVPLSGRSG